MLETRTDRVLPFSRFIKRLLLCIAIAGGLMAVALGIGVVGYHVFGQLPWIDALLNAAMILTGMGPVDRLPTDAAKVFASLYALFSGLVFITTIGVVIAPIFHRVLHRFHLDEADFKNEP
jgi:hypothetical protein